MKRVLRPINSPAKNLTLNVATPRLAIGKHRRRVSIASNRPVNVKTYI